MRFKALTACFILLIVCLLIETSNFPSAKAPTIMNAVGSVGLPIQFTETSNYIRLNFTMFTIYWYKAGYEVICNKGGSVIVYEHNMVLQHFNMKTGKWVQTGDFQGLSWKRLDDYRFQVIKSYVDKSTVPWTNYTVTFNVKSDSPVKVVINIENGGEARQYRLLWTLDGIVYANWVEKKNVDNVKHQLLFGDESIEYGWLAIDWQDIYEQLRTDIASHSVSTSAQGRKADVYFAFPNQLTAKQVFRVDPSLVGTTTSSTAVREGFQRKSFYANGRFWVFYSDGANIVYRTSVDGSTWSNAVTIRSAERGDSFSVWFDGAYLHYAYAYNSPIYYRKGTPNADGSITWSANEQTVSTLYNKAYVPFVSVDSNGYVWIGYRDSTGTYYYPYVVKSGNNNGTWGSTPSGFPYRLSATTSPYWTVTATPLSNGKMVAVYTRNSDVIRIRSWSGSAWNMEKQTESAIFNSYQYSVVSEGDIAHLAFLKADTYEILHVAYTFSNNSLTSEHAVISYSASTYTAVVLSRNPFSGELYCFWTTRTNGRPSGAIANHIYYQVSADGGVTWSNMKDWINEGSDTLTHEAAATGFFKAYDGYMSLVYMTKTSSPYNVKFAFMALSTPKIAGIQSRSHVYGGEFFYLNVTVTHSIATNYVANLTVSLNNVVTLLWQNNSEPFKIYGYTAILDFENSQCKIVDEKTLTICFRLALTSSFPEGSVSCKAVACDVHGCLDIYQAPLLYFEAFKPLYPPGGVYLKPLASVAPVELGTVKPGETREFTVNLHFTAAEIVVRQIKCEPEGYATCLESLPIRRLYTQNGTASIPFALKVPENISAGKHSITLFFAVQNGKTTATCTGKVSFTVAPSTQPKTDTTSAMLFYLTCIAMLIAFLKFVKK